MKALASIAFLGLASASQDNEFAIFNNNRPQKGHPNLLQNNLQLTGFFEKNENSKVSLGKFDDEELFSLAATASKKESIISLIFKKLFGVLDDELTDEELHIIATAAATSQKNNAFLSMGKKLFGELSDEELHTIAAASQKQNVFLATGKKLFGILGNDDDELSDEELHLLAAAASQNKNVFLSTGQKLFGFLDDELSNEELNIIAAAQKQNVFLSTTKKLFGILDGDDESTDEELFRLGDLINDGLNISGDIKNKDNPKRLLLRH